MRIFLVRHGESLGNVDDSVYKRLRDYNVPLTEWGYEQSIATGNIIKEYYNSRPDIKDKRINIWYSPFLRAAQTKDGIIEGLGKERVGFAREDFLLREQDFGIFSDMPDEKIQKKKFPEEYTRYMAQVQNMGKFYARPPLGENRADTTERARLFKETLMRDVHEGQEDAIIIGHGVINRAFEMDFLHKGVEWFEKSTNPGNCTIILIEGDKEKGYTAMQIYEGKTRPASLPKNYKAAPYGSEASPIMGRK